MFTTLTRASLSSSRSLHLKRITFARLARAWQKSRKRYLSFDRSEASALPIDIMTPLVAKDLDTFSQFAGELHDNILHPIGNHYVVGPDQQEIRDACRRFGFVFICEQDILEDFQETIIQKCKETGYRRHGWLLQQFLKLNIDKICQNKNCLILDSDTHFLHPVKFEHQGKTILDFTDGYKSEYDYITAALLDQDAFSCFSFITHYMLFNCDHVVSLRNVISNKLGMDWQQAILDNLDYSKEDCFSEYELYGNFVLNAWPDDFLVGYWFNLERAYSLSDGDNALPPADELSGYKSLSSHHQPHKYE